LPPQSVWNQSIQIKCREHLLSEAMSPALVDFSKHLTYR
jgi:hypothetical protein